MAAIDFLAELSAYLSRSERRRIFKLFMSYCDNKEKVAAKLLKKSVPSIYRFTTGAGFKKPLVPDSKTIAKIVIILLKSEKADSIQHLHQIEVLRKVFTELSKRLTGLSRKSNALLDEIEWSYFRKEEIDSKPGWVIRKICAYCGLGAVFPREYDGRIVCLECFRDLERGLIRFPKET